MTFDAQDRCEVCGRFVQTLAPGVSWSQSWGYCMDGSPDIYDPTYRCSPCTDAYGVRPSNCAPATAATVGTPLNARAPLRLRPGA